MSLNCEQDGEKKASEHFHSSFDPETCLKNANISTGALGILNLHLCTQCHTRHSTRKLLDEHVIQNHPDLIGLISGKVYECPNCTYKTTLSTNLTKHVLRNCEVTAQQNFKACKHCNKTFRTKLNLDNHILRKHSDLSATISSKIYECTQCTYKTTHRGCLFVHKLKHPETAHIGKLRCIHCSLSFNNDRGLDNHILKKHPSYSSSIRSKIYECPQCSYKTTLKLNIDSHVLSQHPDLSATVSSKKCLHCNSNFHSIRSLDDHMVKKHPTFTSSIGSKIHECTKCTYKTTIKAHFGNHILKKHPDLSETVSSKIHKCTNCAYKTTNKSCFSAHLLKHSETDNKHKCTQCTANFSTKRGLANHVLKVHQNSDASVDSKIHGCPKCAYKSTFKKNLDDHVLRKHPDISATVSSKIHVCTKCTYKTTNRSALAVHELKHS
nr:unnamed protein product [Callosobruchus chinensis]